MKKKIGSTYFYENFISQEEQEVIREWALRNEKHLIPNPRGPYRGKALFEQIPENLEILYKIKNRIISFEGLKENEFEFFRGDFLSIQRNGAQVTEHKDENPYDKSFHSRRYNVFISLPEKGGLPIYNGEVLYVIERALLKVESGIFPHSTTKIESEKPRILLSYGFAVLN